MKTTIWSSGLLVCSVLFAVGCARTLPPTEKTAANPAEAPASPTTTASPTSEPQSLAQGTEDDSVRQTSVTPEDIQPNADKTAEILSFIESLDLPLVPSFDVPKYDEKKEKVNFLVGHNCSKILAAAIAKGGPGNLAKEVDPHLCDTAFFRSGHPKVLVIQGKYISRETHESGIVDSSFRRYEIILRPDSTVAGFRETTSGAGFLHSHDDSQHMKVVLPKGLVLEATNGNGRDSMEVVSPGRGLSYTVRADHGTSFAPAKTQKTLNIKNYKGAHLTVSEETISPFETILGGLRPGQSTCSILLMNDSLETTLSTQLRDRCFYRSF